MNSRITLSWTAIVIALCSASIATAGPDWVEVTDAGRLPGEAQIPVGDGTLHSIFGQLGASAVASGPVDTEDMYAIYISDPLGFTATTFGSGFTMFDSQLWLFDSNGRAVLANDDFPSAPPASGIEPIANDGTGQTIPGRGLYYLAITGYNNDPKALSGAPLFLQATRTELSGPDGPGGSQPVARWGTSSESGTYLIALSGAAFVPPDCDGDGIFDPDDDDIDNDSIPNTQDTCNYTPAASRSLVITDRAHPLLGSLPCDMDGDCDCDLDDYYEFQRLFSGIGCKDGKVVTTSDCPSVP